MNDTNDSRYGQTEGFTAIIHKAQQGDQASMGRLAGVAEPRLRTYIFRLTLNQELTEDLCQKTLVKMVQSLKALEDINRFWNWLLRHAMGEVQHFYRDQKRRREVEIEALNREYFKEYVARNHQDGLDRSSRIELSEIIHDAIAELKFTYRNVLVLRCYEELSFAEIAEFMDCKELRARVLFFRAKRALRQHLSLNGFSKETLLEGLGFFGILTLSGQATTTACSVKTASLNVGFLAMLAGSVWTREGVAIITAASALLAGITYREAIVSVVIGGLILGVLGIVGLYFCLD
ncbi:MAG: RNA polymerase sigma factor [Sedimentisphaerales bacterium]|nr:RNA polymerase sigma factor [Sedimentisphaerales bacterium]